MAIVAMSRMALGVGLALVGALHAGGPDPGALVPMELKGAPKGLGAAISDRTFCTPEAAKTPQGKAQWGTFAGKHRDTAAWMQKNPAAAAWVQAHPQQAQWALANRANVRWGGTAASGQFGVGMHAMQMKGGDKPDGGKPGPKNQAILIGMKGGSPDGGKPGPKGQGVLMGKDGDKPDGGKPGPKGYGVLMGKDGDKPDGGKPGPKGYGVLMGKDGDKPDGGKPGPKMQGAAYFKEGGDKGGKGPKDKLLLQQQMGGAAGQLDGLSRESQALQGAAAARQGMR